MKRFIRPINIFLLLVLLLDINIESIAAPQPDKINLDALQSALEDLAESYPEHFTGYLGKLKEYQASLAEIEAASPQPDQSIQLKLDQLNRSMQSFQRQVLLGNPLVNIRPIAFVVRPQYPADHHNTATMFQTGEINTNSFRGSGAIKTIDLSSTGRVNTLLELTEGMVRDLEISFDGRKILFSMRENIKDDYQ
ncbi:MAG: hypothetical protein JXD22_01790 [Sedimentisphaerales bacterium]|nr:hypothetical protein [Sedimentisphaerales bacterium]